jgi:hypothetical protein
MHRLEIDHRPIIPIRLIPYVTGWSIPPDGLARMLSHRDGFNHVQLKSYHLVSDGSHHPILAKEWDRCLADMEILTNTLKASEKVEDENYPVWRETSVKMLPAAAFVWLDELEDLNSTVFSEERLTLPKERQGDRELNLSPLIPSEMAELVYEGFETLVVREESNHLANATPTVNLTTNLVVKEESSHLTNSPVEATSSSTNQFVLTGDHWAITYQGQTRTLIDTKGLRYIAYLLQNQGKEVPVAELYYAINPTDIETIDSTYSAMTADQLDELGLSLGDLGDAGDTLTPEGKSRLEQAIRVLQEQIDEAREFGNDEKAAKLEQEQEEILSHITTESGLGGKPRKASSSIERLRKAVTKRIRDDIKKITTTCPDLGHHLNETIRTGTQCHYSPHPSVEWLIDP